MIEDLLDYSKIESGSFVLDQVIYNLVDQIKIVADLRQVMTLKKKIKLMFSSDPAYICVKADRNKTEHVCSIRDLGMGISAEKLLSIFNPFTKAGSSGTRGERSNGLGLTIAIRIFEAQGGTISVTSEEGKGSDFSFTLPRVYND